MRACNPLVRVQSSVAAAIVCAALTVNGPATAAYLDQDFTAATQRLQASTFALTDATRAVLKAQTAETLEPFASSVADLVLSTDQNELAKLVDASLDATLSIPSDSAASVTKAVKEAFAGTSADSCDLVPLPTAALSRIASSDAVSRTDPAKVRGFVQQWGAAIQAVPKSRDGGVCLPAKGPKLDSAALAQIDAANAIDASKLVALKTQAETTVKSVSKGKSFKLYSNVATQQRSFLGAANFQDRDRFKKASIEFVDANAYLAEIKQKRADGAPKCFTIGCSTNYEYDIWRNNVKDDYTGEGLEKAAAILSPKGISKEDLEQRAQEFKQSQK